MYGSTCASYCNCRCLCETEGSYLTMRVYCKQRPWPFLLLHRPLNPYSQGPNFRLSHDVVSRAGAGLGPTLPLRFLRAHATSRTSVTSPSSKTASTANAISQAPLDTRPKNTDVFSPRKPHFPSAQAEPDGPPAHLPHHVFPSRPPPGQTTDKSPPRLARPLPPAQPVPPVFRQGCPHRPGPLYPGATVRAGPGVSAAAGGDSEMVGSGVRGGGGCGEDLRDGRCQPGDRVRVAEFYGSGVYAGGVDGGAVLLSGRADF